jgi:hypothetical protein
MLEDVARNQVSHDHRYKPTFETSRPFWLRTVYSPTVGNVNVLIVINYTRFASFFPPKDSNTSYLLP